MLVSSLDQIVSLICATSGDSILASFSAARSLAICSLARSSHSPISNRLRSGERFAATPGATISLDEKITPPMIRSLGIAARSRPPGSRKARSGTGGCFGESPISYHQGMPFCANTTEVSAPSNGCSPVARLGTPVAFSVLMTTSCAPSAAGSSDAFTLALNSASPTRSARPLALTAARWGPRITQETSCPASASRTAMWLPTAPAPKTHIRIELRSC